MVAAEMARRRRGIETYLKFCYANEKKLKREAQHRNVNDGYQCNESSRMYEENGHANGG